MKRPWNHPELTLKQPWNDHANGINDHVNDRVNNCVNKPPWKRPTLIPGIYILQEIRLKLGFKLRLTDLLIKPIQRLTKYHMLLEAIVKYSQRAGLTAEAEALSKAFHVMTVVPNQANDMMDIGRLQGFEGKITAQGKLLHRGPLNALDTFSLPGSGSGTSGGLHHPGGGESSKTPPKMKPFTCFLFEQIMIFSETVGKKTQFTSPVYVYKAHFLVSTRLIFPFPPRVGSLKLKSTL